MDQSHAEKAREAGEALPQPDIPDAPPQKPPLSKKCFMTLVLLILIGITGGIGYVMKRKKEAEAEREFLATSTTARPTTTTPPLSDLSDDEILKKCGHKFKAVLGKSDISVFKGWNGMPEEAQKSAFWLEGDLEQDKASIKKAKVLACLEEIPTFVINMRPAGLRLMHDQNDLTYFDKQPVHQNWEEYDNYLKKLVADMKAIPSIVIVEPKLLQLTYDVNNLQYDYENGMFRDAFIERAQKITNALQKSWVYIDAGDSNYLHEDDHLEHIAKTLLRVKNIRGFAMNSAFFANLTFVEMQARRIACRTDLYYITDTSRSGGEFSNQEIEKIAACRYDPPNVKSSNKPMWGYSASQAARAATGKTRRRRATQTLSYDQFRPAEPEPRGWSRGYTGEFGGARLRMSNTLGGAPPMGPAIKEEVPTTPRGQIRSQAYAKSFGGGGGGNVAGAGGAGQRGNDPLSDTAAAGKMQAIELKNKRRRCLSKNSKMTKSDGFVWLRPNGESDGRLAKRGEWLLCLKKHKITCDDTCPLLSGQPCGCDGKAAQYGGYGGAPGAPYGGQPAGYPAGYPMPGYQPGYPAPGHMPVPYPSYQQPGPNYFQG